jgi:phenylacetic acid degradation operon negative regulatory protein
MIERLMQNLPVTAASFIVTIYGDVVVPRGEVMWIGSLIEICGPIGISENLVRTAVSRLVSNEQLKGERNGRRSYYRLAASARAEFAQAARLLYNRPRDSEDWLIVLAPDMTEEQARRFRMAHMAGDLWLCPTREEELPQTDGLILRASSVGDPARVAQLAAFWDLPALHARYQAMLTRFLPVVEILQAGQSISNEDALIVRLLLVHVYRSVVLRDPGLPKAALPDDWPGSWAQDLFRDLYLRLSPQADQHIGDRIKGSDGPLPAASPQTLARIAALT